MESYEIFQYEHGDHKELICEAEYLADGSLIWREDYEYTREDSAILMYTVRRYVIENGKEVLEKEEIQYYDSIPSTHTILYENELPVEKLIRYKDELNRTVSIYYNYDTTTETFVLREKFVVTAHDDGGYTQDRYIFNENDEPILTESIQYYYKDGAPVLKLLYSYLKNGNVKVEKYEMDAQGEWELTKSYYTDQNGNIIEP